MFEDRKQAGHELAQALKSYRGKDCVILALPRGGVVLGAIVSKTLRSPLGLVLVRKIGHPYYPEYAVGAVAENDKPLFNRSETDNLDQGWLKQAASDAREIIELRREDYLGDDILSPDVKDKTAIIVDDGIATGLTVEAAARWLKKQGASRVVVAVPVAPVDSINKLRSVADEIIVLKPPEDFLGAVGSHYRKFEQVDDYEVKALLREVSHVPV